MRIKSWEHRLDERSRHMESGLLVSGRRNVDDHPDQRGI
jgi:hypothetical protein